MDIAAASLPILALAALCACVAAPTDTAARRVPMGQAQANGQPDAFDRARRICGPVPVKKRPERSRRPEDVPQEYECDFERVGL